MLGLNQIFCTLYNKATLALHRFILPEDFFNHLINDKVTVLPLMPVNISQMFDDDMQRIPSAGLFDGVKTITSSGGNVTAKMIRDCKHTFQHADFYSMHGLTEAFRSTYLDPSQDQNEEHAGDPPGPAPDACLSLRRDHQNWK